MNLQEQVSQWSGEGRWDRIIEAAGGIPESELDMYTLCQLALAYNNTDRLKESIDLLMRVWDVGEDHPVWNYYLGYALVFSGREEEAREHLLRARELDPAIPAENILHFCVCRDGGDGPVDDGNLRGWVCDMLGGEMDGGAVCLPELGLRITPWYDSIEGEGPVATSVYFRIDLRDGASFFECCVGMGGTVREATTASLGSFYIGIYSALKRLCSGQRALEVQDARGRTWGVYIGEVVGMGANPTVDLDTYWKLLGPSLPAYLGGQNPVYVKLYGARNGDAITAECRVDDRVSEDLSALLREPITGWDDAQFASHKQFFFLRCEGDVAPYPYTDEQMDDFVGRAVALFCDESIDYDDIFDRLAEYTGDPHLTNELYAFIPEICAERAFETVTSGDGIHIVAGGCTIESTKWQVSSWRKIDSALWRGFGEGRYPEDAFGRCVEVSSTYSVICEARNKGHDLLSSGGKVSRYYNFHDGYVLR